MKLNSVSCPSFQKTLVAQTKFRKNVGDEKPQDCKIYLLDDYDDISYLANLKFEDKWKNAVFLDIMDYDLSICLDPRSQLNTYVMEMGDEGECIACAQTDRNYNATEITYLETAPAYQNSPYNPRYSNIKYIGETFLAFFAKQAKKKSHTSRLELTSVFRAMPFYKEKCGFVSRSPATCEVKLILNEDKYKPLIKQNKKHTGSRLKLEG